MICTAGAASFTRFWFDRSRFFQGLLCCNFGRSPFCNLSLENNVKWVVTNIHLHSSPSGRLLLLYFWNAEPTSLSNRSVGSLSIQCYNQQLQSRAQNFLNLLNSWFCWIFQVCKRGLVIAASLPRYHPEVERFDFLALLSTMVGHQGHLNGIRTLLASWLALNDSTGSCSGVDCCTLDLFPM